MFTLSWWTLPWHKGWEGESQPPTSCKDPEASSQQLQPLQTSHSPSVKSTWWGAGTTPTAPPVWPSSWQGTGQSQWTCQTQDAGLEEAHITGSQHPAGHLGQLLRGDVLLHFPSQLEVLELCSSVEQEISTFPEDQSKLLVVVIDGLTGLGEASYSWVSFIIWNKVLHNCLFVWFNNLPVRFSFPAQPHVVHLRSFKIDSIISLTHLRSFLLLMNVLVFPLTFDLDN